MRSQFIAVATKDGPFPVKAFVFGKWAVHHPIYSVNSREWVVTHVPSGLRVPDGYLEGFGKADAIRVATALDAARPALQPVPKHGKRAAKIVVRTLNGAKRTR